MEIHLDKKIADKDWAKEAKSIVRKCVHCGFCNATCPTYQVLGHESDGPRGRIYLITQLLEGQPANRQTQAHLDRCLLCRACETTCPSGVKYSRLLETGRHMLEQQAQRRRIDSLKRKVMTTMVPRRGIVQTGVNFATHLRPLLPKHLEAQLPIKGKNLDRPKTIHPRKMLLLEGCAQSSLTPETNAAAARVLDRFGITLLTERKNGCCGAVRLHTSAREEGLQDVKQRIDTWWPDIEAGIEAIISTASGCGVTVKDYGHLLKDDQDYAEKAFKVSELTVDLSEVISAETRKSPPDPDKKNDRKVAFHCPCSLQHGQKLSGQVEDVLQQYNFTILPITDGHICCGSAGTYSMLQPVLSEQLKVEKLEKLQTHSPDAIATANVGCQLHLRKDARVPVLHWIELLDSLT
ncbi:MAG: glycolate oxidase subunit GlcF [Gammaproteobacteria bacterium]|nr:glycolate oxidase subunit GlcF [Gammaproteobacteria bacterium]